MSVQNYHINPDRSIPWNGLPPLPIDPSLYRKPEILEKLGDTKAALGRLQGRSIAIPNPGILINTIILQEAKASSAIENIFTTDDELYKAFSETMEEQPAEGTASKEVLRYREAMWSGFEDMNSKPGFDADYFIRIYHEIKQSIDGFRLPFHETVIRQGGSDGNAGQIIYTPPRGPEVISRMLENLTDFVNDDDTFPVDPVLKMAMSHYQFEAIHPFRDGNGRTGRIFSIHLLAKKGLLDLPVLFLSRYIMDNKAEYYAGLAGVTLRGDWQNWLLYMLRAVEITANLTYEKINAIIRARENILDYVKQKDPKIRRPEQLVNSLFVQPYTRVKHLQLSKTYAEGTARNYLNRLAEIGVVEKRTIEGNHYYLNTELYRILAE